MKREKATAECSSAWGKAIDKFKFDYEFDAYETYAELQAANKVPDNDTILKFVNRQSNASARATEQSKQLTAKGYKKPDLNDADYRFEQMVKMAEMEGNTHEEAVELVKMLRKK